MSMKSDQKVAFGPQDSRNSAKSSFSLLNSPDDKIIATSS